MRRGINEGGEIPINRFRNRIIFLSILAILATLYLAFSVTVCCLNKYELLGIEVCFLFALSSVALIFGMLIHELYIYRMAKMICENSIMQINVAIVNSFPEKVKHSNNGLIIYVSCFGILIGNKIVSYNANGKKLNSISIDSEYLEISYCDKNLTRSVKILHGALAENEIARIKQHFCYETGITPSICN